MGSRLLHAVGRVLTSEIWTGVPWEHTFEEPLTMLTVSHVADRYGVTTTFMVRALDQIGCRNMDAGTGKPSTYLDCFEWFLAPYPLGGDPMHDGDPTKAPNVVNIWVPAMPVAVSLEPSAIG